MMFHHNQYLSDIQQIAKLDLPWDKLDDKHILITGATGLINSVLIDAIMYRNLHYNNRIFVIAVGRSIAKLREKFSEYISNAQFAALEWDINESRTIDLPVDYIVNGASNTHPVAYANEPVNTILTNIVGLNNILNLASAKNCKRVVVMSTIEIYGSNGSDTTPLSENFCGYINCNTLRAGYPESKRAAEALCQAYRKQHLLDIVIARPCRIYGPTMGIDDSKAVAQFLRAGLAGENIILKSQGLQNFSYCYMADVASALLFLLFKGENGEAYNIADDEPTLLKDVAAYIAEQCETTVVFDLPNDTEKLGFSNADTGILDTQKLKMLSWSPTTDIKSGIKKSINIMKDCN